MTTLTQLRTAGGAGPADSLAPLRLDVVMAAEALIDAEVTKDWGSVEDASMRLYQAVTALKKARLARQRGMR